MRSYLVSLLALALLSAPASAGIVVLDDVERGEFTSSGTNFDGTDFMVIGESVFHNVPEYRSFLTFNLAGIRGCVVGACLSLQIDNYNEASSLSFSVYDYTLGNDALLGMPLESVEVFEDLGTGVKYGAASVNVTDNPIGSTFLVPLSAAAVADINNKRGLLFTVGFADDEITGGNNANIRLDSDPSIRINQLVLNVVPRIRPVPRLPPGPGSRSGPGPLSATDPHPVPEPSSLLLLTLGLATLVLRHVRKRRHTAA